MGVAIKERLLKFIDFKRVSKREFCKKSSLSHTIFNNNSAIGSDKLEKIHTAFDELNMDWVITGRGRMILELDHENLISMVAEDAIPITISWKEKYFELLGKMRGFVDDVTGKKNEDAGNMGKHSTG